MPPSDSSTNEVEGLNTLISNSILVVKQLDKFVQEIYEESNKQSCNRQATELPVLSAEAWDPPTTLNALALAHDAAALIRAHATKISLLIINEPFTPSAISKVVKELVDGPVPALAKAVEVCYGNRYTYCIQRDLATRCQRVLLQVQLLLETIPKNGRVLLPEKSGGGDGTVKNGNSTEGSFMGIGILWTKCGSVTALAKLGVSGRLIQLVEQLAETLKDELEELKEWGEEEDDDDEEADEDEEDAVEGEAHTAVDGQDMSTQEMLDRLMNTDRHISARDPHGLRPRLAATLKKIRLTNLLCAAVIKRRLRKLPTLPSAKPSDIAPRLDNAMMVLQELPDRFGDLAEAFYDLSVARVDSHMDQCFEDAFVASELLVRPWEGKQDEFSDWALKFQAEIRTTLRGEK